MHYVMISSTGKFFIIEPFGYTWKFEGLSGLGYWNSRQKMIDFYKEAFGLEYLGEL